MVSKSFANGTAAPTVDNGTALWRDYYGNTNQPSMIVHQGVQLFISPTPLETLPAFAAAKDSDNDGLPDVWEDANLFNKNLASDATGDADLDGLNNRDEFLASTNPRMADTDSDGISDALERTNRPPCTGVTSSGFLRQLNCAAVGSSAILNTLLNLKLANRVAAQGGPTDNKALV